MLSDCNFDCNFDRLVVSFSNELQEDSACREPPIRRHASHPLYSQNFVQLLYAALKGVLLHQTIAESLAS